MAEMNAIEKKILEKLSRLEDDQQRRVLEFVEQLTMPTRRYTARELMQVPVHERNTILRAQLERFADEKFETFEA
jgi:hypothetical protein